eukprot:1934085-Rhodomonas_salina.1
MREEERERRTLSFGLGVSGLALGCPSRVEKYWEACAKAINGLRFSLANAIWGSRSVPDTA